MSTEARLIPPGQGMHSHIFKTDDPYGTTPYLCLIYPNMPLEIFLYGQARRCWGMFVVADVALRADVQR